MDWLFLQLVDSAFPAGGFAHSNGLEAAIAFRDGVTIEQHLSELTAQAGRTALPFVREACATPERLAELDALFDATTTSHVVNRASRAQGRALVSAAGRIWTTHEGAQRIATYARSEPAPPVHHAPVLGAIFGALGQTPEAAMAGYLHGVVRGVLSAAVRLGVVGPLEAQRLQGENARAATHAVEISRALTSSEVSQPAPLLELYATLHDGLDARLFQS